MQLFGHMYKVSLWRFGTNAVKLDLDCSVAHEIVVDSFDMRCNHSEIVKNFVFPQLASNKTSIPCKINDKATDD